jgi:hypothetical protein
MKVLNRQILTTCPFDNYLELPGWSHSKIRNDGQPFLSPTKRMQMGTKVHNYLLEPHLYDHDDEAIVKPLAREIRRVLGPLWKYLQPELAVTATFVHNGFAMQYHGRGDLVIPNRLVIDIKITEQPISKGIEHFGYDNAISGYCLGFNARAGLIITANPSPKKLGEVFVYNVPLSADWWEYQIIQKGEPIK